MSTFGLLGLLLAFAGTVVSIVCLLLGEILTRRNSDSSAGETLTWGGHIAVFLSFAGLTFCCGLLVFCFMTGDMSIEYVLEEHSDSSSQLAWLYKLSGLWAGRQGSLLFWAWLISVFNTVIAARNLKNTDRLDAMALLVSQLVLAAFVGLMLFSEDNMPFIATDEDYFEDDGSLTTAASLYGMNTLLEHWAMAIHPPTLFIGYAGLTIPFAYAIAALIVNDPSKKWVVKAQRYALFAWLFLGVGIGLGSIWAYVVLGWGGYWGWDAVENASLLSWLVGLALIHSFTVYRQRGAFRRWSVMCACLTFSFVIVGTFISRSGLVESVHAFEGDPVSLALFGALIVIPIVVGAIGLIIRRKSFGPNENGNDEIESMASKDAAYYFNNVILIVFAVLLAYLTLSSAFPEWLPFGGESVSTGTFDAIARPLGILYLAILAICPLLAWGKTDPKKFWKQARIPLICAIVLFVVLMIYFATYLLPGYNAIIAEGGTDAEELLEMGPSWYYNGLAVVGFFVASVLFFNSLFMLGRAIGNYKRSHSCNALKATFGMLRHRASTLGGFFAHLSMAVILVGLIGSSMYVTEEAGYVEYDSETDTASEDFTIRDYTLVYTGNDIVEQDNEDDIDYTVYFDVYRNGEYLGSVDPTVTYVASTMQSKLVASVISLPTEDLFVVYNGVNEDGDLSMDVRVNPLIYCVWIGFGMLMFGIALATFGGRGGASDKKKEKVAVGAAEGAAGGEVAAAAEPEPERIEAAAEEAAPADESEPAAEEAADDEAGPAADAAPAEPESEPEASPADPEDSEA